jgi:hypothetical protein
VTVQAWIGQILLMHNVLRLNLFYRQLQEEIKLGHKMKDIFVFKDILMNQIYNANTISPEEIFF